MARMVRPISGKLQYLDVVARGAAVQGLPLLGLFHQPSNLEIHHIQHGVMV